MPDAGFEDPEHRLYRLLERDGEDGAHSRYNALVRTLVSFERGERPRSFRRALDDALGRR